MTNYKDLYKEYKKIYLNFKLKNQNGGGDLKNLSPEWIKQCDLKQKSVNESQFDLIFEKIEEPRYLDIRINQIFNFISTFIIFSKEQFKLEDLFFKYDDSNFFYHYFLLDKSYLSFTLKKNIDHIEKKINVIKFLKLEIMEEEKKKLIKSILREVKYNLEKNINLKNGFEFETIFKPDEVNDEDILFYYRIINLYRYEVDSFDEDMIPPKYNSLNQKVLSLNRQYLQKTKIFIDVLMFSITTIIGEIDIRDLFFKYPNTKFYMEYFKLNQIYVLQSFIVGKPFKIIDAFLKRLNDALKLFFENKNQLNKVKIKKFIQVLLLKLDSDSGNKYYFKPEDIDEIFKTKVFTNEDVKNYVTILKLLGNVPSIGYQDVDGNITEEIIMTEFLKNEKLNNENIRNLVLGGKFLHQANIQKYGKIEDWDVSNVTDMTELFNSFSLSSISLNLSKWDTSNVKSMRKMFAYTKVKSLNISTWKVGNVENMENMFLSFHTDINISEWNVSKVKTMKGMFAYSKLHSLDISKWNVSNVENMEEMFTSSDIDINISEWNVSNVKTMQKMFAYSKKFNSDISNWNVSNVENMDNMFLSSRFNQDITKWNVINVKTMDKIFEFNPYMGDIKPEEYFEVLIK